MVKRDKIKNYIMRNKEGALLGAIIGYFLSLIYTKIGGQNLTFIFQSQGVIDSIISHVQTPQIIYIKLALFSILAGAIIGMVLDEHVRWL